jgi:hypothetical protein
MAAVGDAVEYKRGAVVQCHQMNFCFLYHDRVIWYHFIAMLQFTRKLDSLKPPLKRKYVN